MGVIRRSVLVAVIALLAGASFLAGAGVAAAATGDVGQQGPSYSGAPHVPTSDKPQSKLWYAQGSWWGVMFDTSSADWHIFRLDRSTQQWVDTGVRVDDRADTLADVLWDGSHLYVASHVVTISSDTSAVVSRSNSPARLYRYSYSASLGYTLDAGFPTTITDYSSESLTIDKDSTGTLWATWTQVSAAADGSYTSRVHANATSGGDTTWGTPFVLPVAGSTASQDDISSVVAFGRSRIGILWSNQLDGTVYWAVHDDGSPRGTWRVSPAVRGDRQADDHLNIKAVQADTSGRVFAVVKTSMDGSATAVPGDPQIRLLSFKPGTGAWSATTVGTLADCHTRPLLMLDESHQSVHVFATAPTSGGCPFPGAPGTIYQKSAPMADPVFAAGRGTPVIREAASPHMNDVTSTKQSVTAASGLVVLASNKATQRYWHAEVPLGPVAGVPPTAAFTASSAGGAAPLPVQFTDTSTGSPTSWAWDFGDGTTATTQNPSHTYTRPGTYTVGLAATNAGGTSTPATTTVTVTAAATATGVVTAGASTTAGATTAAAEVTLSRPAGVVDGTVLIAQITADGAPTMSTVPAGWTAVLTRPLALGTGARVFAYSHVVTDAAAGPAAYTWQLSAPLKWGAGMTAFAGVDPVTPFDSATSTAVDTTYAATSLTVAGPTTVSDGAMLVGGIGLDNTTAGVTAPSAWTEAWESTGAQVAELTHRQTATAGPTPALTWNLSRATAAGGWARALRPVPQAPTASFTTSPASGEAPLDVQFTDTSTGGPTAWAWDFGDGTTSTAQNPAHTYTQPGSYAVTLTATNAVGTGTPATRTVTATAPPPVTREVSAGAATTAVSTSATTAVTVGRPAGLATGDVLLATITADNAPTMGSAPAGWAPVLSAPVSIGGGARVFVYSHVVADVAAEAMSYTWRLSAAQKWGAVLGSFRGVDTTAVFDTAATTAVDKSFAVNTLTVPGVTTVTPGAMIVSGVGLDSSAAGLTAPTGWTEVAESSGAQAVSLGHKAMPTAGDGGNATWTLPKKTASGGWMIALRPAAGSAGPGPTDPAPVAPTSSFTTSVTSGQAPLPVQFTDTSTGAPTSWAWNFGDGATATTQHPSHTYTAAGTYTVTLTAGNAAGAGTPVSRTITVTADAPPRAGAVTAGQSATASSTTATTAVAVGRPAGVRSGDVLVAQITADGAPAMGAVPSGWSPVLTGPLAIGSGARVFVYHHIITDVATEPASYRWDLSAGQKWNAVMTAFSGVDTANPFDSSPSGTVDTTYRTASLTVPGVTTVTAGAMVIGGVGLDSSAAGVTAPSGWTESGESSGAQTAELAHRSMSAAGASGDATWTLPKATASAGWLRALRPAV